MSRLKRWRVTRVIKLGQQIDAAHVTETTP
jgi:hypothetical protein